MPTQNQPWLRAELIAAPETAPGAQLMIPADTVEFHDDELVFHHQGDIVYVAPQGQLRAITWFARQPHPETARRSAQWPNHGTRWTDEERTELHRHLRTGTTGRPSPTPTAAPAQAASRRRPSRAGSTARRWPRRQGCWEAGAEADIAGTPSDPTPSLVLATATTDSPASADLTATAADSSPSPAQANATTGSAPTIAQAAAPADPPPSAVLVTASAGSSPSTDLAAASAGGSSPNPAPAPSKIALSDAPPSPARAGASTGSPSKIVLAASPADPLPSPSLADVLADLPARADIAAASSNPAAVPPNFAVAGAAHAVAYPDLAQAAMAIAREASAHTDTELQPEHPQIPHQRSDAADTPDPEKDSPPGPGSRFLSRAQSSLARATLGAYVNPPRAT